MSSTSLCSALGLPELNILGVDTRRDVVLLLVDGLGSELLHRHADAAPTLAAHVRRTLTAGFPATTATSLTSLAVGAPCATHGIIGYSFGVPDEQGRRLFNSLRWTIDGTSGEDARETHPPEDLQRRRSKIEDLAAAGIDVHYVVPGYQEGSGLTRAAFRAPGVFHPASSPDEIRDGILSVAQHDSSIRRFAYAYYAQLDMAGHIYGPGSHEWRAALREVEAMFVDVLSSLPPTCTLVVTGDHGMIAAQSLVNLETMPGLLDGVRLLAGEARVRHVYLERGYRADEVAQRWAEQLDYHALVVKAGEVVNA